MSNVEFKNRKKTIGGNQLLTAPQLFSDHLSPGTHVMYSCGLGARAALILFLAPDTGNWSGK